MLENKFIEKQVQCMQLCLGHCFFARQRRLHPLWLCTQTQRGGCRVGFGAYCVRLVSLSSSCQFFSISSLQLRKASSSRRMDSARVGLVRITTMS